MQRSIVHLDADAFFASVEQAADPRLRGKPLAVGGEKRGIIASASYEARKFGIYTPMPTVLARRLCPRLILLPGDFEKYELFSRLMFSYAYDFTPDVEIGSIDEGYFDLTGTRKPPVDIAEKIQHAIRQALKLPVSEGIGGNKLVSQIASKRKKPSAFEFVPYGHEAEFLAPLANQWLPGVGPKTARQLNSAGLARIGQIAQTPVDLLNLLLGSQAPQMRNFARGIDERPVIPVRAPAKSYGEQETFAADTTDEPFLEATLRRMADKLMAKVRQDGKSIRTVTVKARYNDMDEQQASLSLSEPTDLETDIYGIVSALLRKAWQRRVSLRLVALKLSNVYDGRFHGALALDISTRQHAARQRLADTVDGLREKFGRAVLLRGHDFALRAKPRGEEPLSRPVPVRVATSPPHIQSKIENLKSKIKERQRIGNSFARISHSPAPEVRLRTALPPQSKIKNLKSKIESLPLNVHSYYTFLDSTLSPKAIVQFAKRHELPAIALTDKNNLHGAVEFAQTAAAAGIKPIIAAELNWQGRRVCLYVQNEQGYQNLCQILNAVEHQQPESRSHAPESETGPADELQPSLLWPPPNRNSKIENQNFLNDRSPPYLVSVPPNQKSKFEILNSTAGLLAVSGDPSLASFFPGRFYVAIRSLDAWEKYHDSAAAPLPCVASFPVHYELPGDRWKYNIVQSIRTLTLLRQAHPEKRLAGEYHFRSAAELRDLLAVHPELGRHSLEIAERCDFQFSLGKPQFPGYTPDDGSTPAAFLHRLVMDGLRRRYPKDHARLRPQLEEELAIITDVGYEEYFLVMWDLLQECRRRGIEWITRGSAADSLACYCLEISGVCPIRFDLYFRRFLNKERMALNKLPDIDVDFPHDRKDDVIDLIFEKYGPAHTAVVGGFSTFQSRSAFAEVAKVLGVSEYQVRRLTERLPHFSRASELVEAVNDTLECRDLPLDQEPYATALRMAHFLDGFPRYPKMHPCGVVLARQPMDQLTPCFTSAKGYPTTHFDMDAVEAVGLIKMDILAQGGLAVMRDVRQMLQMRNAECGVQNAPPGSPLPKGPKGEGPGVRGNGPTEFKEDAESVVNALAPIKNQKSKIKNNEDAPADSLEPWNHPEVWDLIASGNARAVHHIESPAMISLCRMCNVRDIDTLIAIVSVIRPGAANESKKMEFARRYQGLSPVRYPHPSLESCLRSTYGLVVYEEHILQICEAFAGLPPGRADVLRRALGKNKTELIEQIQTEFADCARRQGRTEAEITEVWDLVVGFRGYAFCKAHSTAYGIEAYQSAWLKLHYPAEFMAAVLTNGKGFYSPLVYVLECHHLGIPLLPPTVNKPGPAFTVEDISPIPHPSSTIHHPPSPTRAIRVPLLQLKGLTQRTSDAILGELGLRKGWGRPVPNNSGRTPPTHFTSLADFYHRVHPLPEEMEALIRVGAFDEFGKSRTAQYWEFKENAESGVRNAEFAAAPAPIENQKSKIKNNNQCSSVSISGSVSPIENLKSKIKNPHHSQLSTLNSQLPLFPPADFTRLPSVPLVEPDRLQRLRAEEELLGYPVSGHPLELFPDIAWETYCPVNRLSRLRGQEIVTCGLVIEQRLFHQVTGEPMKFITIADWTGVVETELFAKTYKSYGLNTVRYRVLEITATVESFENGRGFTLRVLRAGKPRTRSQAHQGLAPG